MDPDEIENADDSANDTVELSEDDTSEDFVYFDPDEDQDTEETEATEETDDEADEAEADDEAENQEAEDESEDPKDVMVPMDDGTSLSLEELKKGYFRQSDYSRKTAETAELKKSFTQKAQRIDGVTQAFVDHLASIMPPEPDTALALSNPGDYTAKKAQYDAAMAQVQKLIDIGSQAKAVSDETSSEDAAQAAKDENAKLAAMFPATAKQETRQAFFQAANQAALNLGFSAEELGGVTDHRMIALAHWANIGMAATEAKTKAKAKAKKAPPATPRKPGTKDSSKQRNTEAMRKLAKSGSLEDAMKVDFI